MALPDNVTLVDVSLRDGLQSLPNRLTLAQKVNMLQGLTKAGLKHIEIGSFVSEQKVPQMKDTDQLFATIDPKSDVCHYALAPNKKGIERAIAANAGHVGILLSASETFSIKNTASDTAQSLERAREVTAIAKSKNIFIRVYLSCIFGCPYGDIILPERVIELARSAIDFGCDQVVLSDTTGVGVAPEVRSLVNVLKKHIPVNRIAIHFHNTYGQALANIYAAMLEGVSTVDGAIAGLGGCPYAPGATGNVAMEDIVYFLEQSGIKTGVNLKALAKLGKQVCSQLEAKNNSMYARTVTNCET